MLTLWPQNRHPTDDEERLVKEFFGGWPNLQYCVAQYETTKDGQIHLQVYLEVKQSIRALTVLNILKTKAFGLALEGNKGKLWKEGCEIQFRKHGRDNCKKYCSNPSKRLEGTKVIEVGEWRVKSTGTKPKVSEQIEWLLEKDDVTLEEIAYKRPHLFLRYGDRIEKLLILRRAYTTKLRYDEEE